MLLKGFPYLYFFKDLWVLSALKSIAACPVSTIVQIEIVEFYLDDIGSSAEITDLAFSSDDCLSVYLSLF